MLVKQDFSQKSLTLPKEVFEDKKCSLKDITYPLVYDGKGQLGCYNANGILCNLPCWSTRYVTLAPYYFCAWRKMIFFFLQAPLKKKQSRMPCRKPWTHWTCSLASSLCQSVAPVRKLRSRLIPCSEQKVKKSWFIHTNQINIKAQSSSCSKITPWRVNSERRKKKMWIISVAAFWACSRWSQVSITKRLDVKHWIINQWSAPKALHYRAWVFIHLLNLNKDLLRFRCKIILSIF